MQFKLVDGILSYLSIKYESNNMSLINVYASTEKAEEDDKHIFYSKLKL